MVAGRLTIRLRPPDGAEEEAVTLDPGQLFVVPRGMEHCPAAEEETSILLVEPRGTRNTGDTGGALTREPEDLTQECS